MKLIKTSVVVTFLLMSFIACGTKQVAESPMAPHFTNFEEARAEAARTDKPMLVSYWADW